MDPSEIVLVTGPLTPTDEAAVRRLARAAERLDGVAPVSEQPLLSLRHGSGITHLLVRAADDLAGYAQLDPGADPATVEGVVHPLARRHGVGSALLARARELAPGGIAVWAHGDLPEARSLARSAGLVVVRELWKMQLDLGTVEATPVALPTGVTLRTFRPGTDDDAWLRVNRRAFATHPEQGRMTLDDLRARTAEPWFDPASFLLAERSGTVIGFCWLKVEADRPTGAERTGEIYALGVDPEAQGLRLGSALTAAGLDRLATLGVEIAELYTEADNTVAIRTYRAAGFTRATVDVQFGLPTGPDTPTDTQDAPSDVTMNP